MTDYAITTADKPRRIVRHFSRHELAQRSENVLMQSVVEQENLDEQSERKQSEQSRDWQQLLQPLTRTQQRNLSELERLSKELGQTWTNFCKKRGISHKWKTSDSPPNINDVHNAVCEAYERLQSDHQHSIGSKLRRACNRLYDFRDGFAMVPKEDKYVCLIAGSFTAIVKASVRYQKIMEVIADFLFDALEDISSWQRQVKDYPRDSSLKRILEEVYVVMFQFFIEALTWLESQFNRFVKSLDGSFSESVRQRKSKLDSLNEKMNREIGLESSRELKAMRREQAHNHENLHQNISFIDNKIDAVKATLDDVVDFFMARQGQEMLRSSAKDELTFSHSRRLMEYAEAEGISGTTKPSNGESRNNPQLLRAKDIQTHISQLSSKSGLNRWDQLLHRSQRVTIHEQTSQNFQSWMASPSSETQWIYGENPDPSLSSNSEVAGYIANITIASGAEASVIGYAYPSRKVIDCSAQGLQAAFMDLLISLATQLTELIPDEAINSLSTTKGQLSALDHSFASAPAFTDLIRELLQLQQQRVTCVIIDGLDNVSFNAAVDSQMAKLAEVLGLRPKNIVMGEGNVVKTLFTTNGYCRGLSYLRPGSRFEIPPLREKALYFGDAYHSSRQRPSPIP